MKRSLYILSFIVTVILLCGITVSCGKDEPDPTQKNAEETVFMFFPYSGLESDIKDNIKYIKSAIVNRGGLGNKRMVVYQAVSTSSANMYEITYENGACTNTIIEEKMTMSFPSGDQASVIAKLQSILQKVKQAAPANGYSMIIGSHGSGWLPSSTLLSDFNHSYAKRKSFGTASALYQIDNVSMATALQNENMHLIFILFDVCYMGNIETMYDYRNVCDYFISSPNEILTEGVPYLTIGDDLLKHNYSGVVDGYYEWYNSKTDSNMGSLSCIDCSKLSQLAAIVQDINNGHINDDGPLNEVQKMDGISPTLFFDLQDYMDKFCTDSTKLASLTSIIKQMVVNARSTEYIFTAFSSSKKIKMNKFCGIATSQPTRNNDATDIVKQSAWWIATH